MLSRTKSLLILKVLPLRSGFGQHLWIHRFSFCCKDPNKFCVYCLLKMWQQKDSDELMVDDLLVVQE